jgi:hypothetical protein
MKTPEDPHRDMIAKLAGQHVTDLLSTHYAKLEDESIVTAENSGKPPKIQARFTVSFNPRTASPRVVTKFASSFALKDEAEDTADARQMKLNTEGDK